MLDAMATLSNDLPRNIHRFSRDQYHKLEELLGDLRCELLEGQIVEKAVVNPPHAGISMRLGKMLHAAAAAKGWLLRPGLPFAATEDSEPHPDLALVTEQAALSTTEHPDRVFLMIEVCHTTHHNDRVIKTRIYAQAGVQEYWIVDVEEKTIEIYTQPRGRRYDSKRVVSEGSVAPSALPDAPVDLSELFG